MSKRSKMLVDAMTVDLAEHFLGDIKSATAEDKNELAEAIQRLCEDTCREIENAAPPRG